MNFIVLNYAENRIENCNSFNTMRTATMIDSVEFDTLDSHLKKNYRLLYRSDEGWHEYLIRSITLNHDEGGVNYHVYADNSICEIESDYIEDKRVVNGSVSDAAQKCFSPTRWEVVTYSKSDPKNINFYRTDPWSGLKELIELYDVELETKIDVSGNKVISRQVIIRDRVGEDNGVRFSFTKNIKAIKKTVNDQKIITALYAFGKGEEIKKEEGEASGYGRRVDFSSINNGIAYVENLDARSKYSPSGRHLFGVIETEIDDKEELLKFAKKELETLSKPSITYEVDVLRLREEGQKADGVRYGDRVTVFDKEDDIILKARVIEIKDDLDHQGKDTITLGNYQPLYGAGNKSLDKRLGKIESKTGIYDRARFFDEDGKNVTYIDNIIDNLNAKFNQGTSHMRFDPNRGLIVTDKESDKDSSWAIEISSLGFRIASLKHSDGTWNFRTFGTGEGFTADLIRAGTIQGGNSKWNLETGYFNVGNKLIFDPSRGRLNIASDAITLDGETTVTGTFKVSGNSLFGTIDADTVNVRNLNADYITSGSLSRGVDNGSCDLPMYGSGSLSGSGTDFNTGSNAFRFDYGQNTFYVDGRITANPTGNHHALEQNGLTLYANSSSFDIKPWGNKIKFDASAPVALNNDLYVNGSTIYCTRLFVDGVEIKR